jgi:hypothetical protein
VVPLANRLEEVFHGYGFLVFCAALALQSN